MLLVKIRNSAELFWETLDPEERRMLVVGCCWLLGTMLAALQSRARERRRAEIIDTIQEVIAGGRD